MYCLVYEAPDQCRLMLGQAHVSNGHWSWRRPATATWAVHARYTQWGTEEERARAYGVEVLDDMIIARTCHVASAPATLHPVPIRSSKHANLIYEDIC
jgi:hypothetical protein